ncbi:hypothetical protein [Thalassoglobus polymorphus]|uniref:hypothetical protein n=1 Tax=Thalassoglobus polymorphus TaxID=2527994 RepID=UPI0011A50CB8|nr:hypothetical protein [Thalassoglobus polymorphus]
MNTSFSISATRFCPRFCVNWVGLFCAVVVLHQTAAFADAEKTPKRLVNQLGNPSFLSRLQAEQELLDLGYRSYSAIVEGTKSSDPEIRYRTLRLMKLLRRGAFADRQQELRANPWIVPEGLAPGWEEFHQMLGDGEDARELYVQILNSETDLMLAVSAPGWQSQFEKRCSDLQAFSHQRQSLQIQPGSIAALLFLACHPENRPSGNASSVITMLISDATFRDAALRSRSSDVLKGLIGIWIRKNRHTSPIQLLSDAVTFDLDAGMEAARDGISRRHQLRASAIHTGNSIFYLAKYGGKDVIEELEKLLSDSAQLPGSFKNSATTVQIRDVALAALLYVTKQDPKKYGFNELRPKSGYLYYANSARFASDQDREKALLLWKSWRANHVRDPIRGSLDASEGDAL